MVQIQLRNQTQHEHSIATNVSAVIQVSQESGNEVEWSKEENYMFPLSLYREQLLDWVDSNPSCKYPPTEHI